MRRFSALFDVAKPLIGMIYLPPLPDYPDSPGLDAIIDSAIRDAGTLADAGFDGALIENEYDRPHRVRAELTTIDSMIRVTRAVVESGRDIVIGCEILLNDPKASLCVAKSAGAAFIRSDYFVDRMMRPEFGEFEIDAGALMAYRSAIAADRILVLADIQVKFARMLEERSLAQSARLACEQHADAVIVTGDATGHAPSADSLRQARQGLEASGSPVPLLVGSGVDVRNAATLLDIADGAIVGTSLMKGGAVDRRAAEALITRARALRAP